MLLLHGHAADTRQHSTLAERSPYASWTHHLPHDSSHPCPTPDVPGVAAFNDRPCWAGSTGPAVVTPGGRDDDYRRCRRRWPEPSPYLQVDTAVCAGRTRGARRQTRTWPSTCAAPASPDRAGRPVRMTHWRRAGGAW